jgi:sugar-specific transcriptional regulator TrmB
MLKMNELKTVEDLEIGYSKTQIYRRIKSLVENDLIDPQRGSRNQYLLSPEDVEVLHRLAELEDGYKGVKSAIVQLENEQLREKVNELEDKNETLQNEIVARNNIIQRLRGKWVKRVKEGFKGVLSWFK